MKRDQFLFLIGGLVFGALIGFGSYHAIHTTPSLDAAAPDPGSAQPPRGPSPAAEPGARLAKRVTQLERMLEEHPDDPRVLLELANVHYDLEVWPKAAEYYERVAELAPNADVLTDLGVCYRALGEFERALEAFARAQTLDPKHWQSLYNMVVVATYDLGRLELAREALGAMEALDPRPPGLDGAQLDRLREAIESAARQAGGPS